MSLFSDSTLNRLHKTFIDDNIFLDVKSDHIIVENSKELTNAKIREWVQNAGFCSLVSPNKRNGNFVFTICPYKIPEFFNQSPVKGDQNLYYSKEELADLLEERAISTTSKVQTVNDRWESINSFRSFITPALNKGLSEIITQCIKADLPIIEIGSGIGYSLLGDLSAKTIRVQPATTECQLLSREISEPVYQMDIKELHASLIQDRKKIPLFFGLNVFDTMSPAERNLNISLLSQLQEKGDKILLLLDTNPFLDSSVAYLKSLHPNHSVFPFFIPSDCYRRFSVIIVPSNLTENITDEEDFGKMIDRDVQSLLNGKLSERQLILNRLQKQHDLKVIFLEDLFAEQMKSEFGPLGYSSKCYYHASFIPGDGPRTISVVNQDLLYKPVTDSMSVRQWSLKDQNLINALAEKGLQLPQCFNESYLSMIGQKGKKILGAEILVIEATKN